MTVARPHAPDRFASMTWKGMAGTIALVWAGALPLAAQPADSRARLSARLEREAIGLLRTYPPESRDQLLPVVVQRFLDRNQEDSALALLRESRTRGDFYLPIASRRLARRDFAGAMAGYLDAAGTLRRSELLYALVKAITDTAAVSGVLGRLPTSAERVRFLAYVAGDFRFADERRSLLLRALSIARSDSGPSRLLSIHALAAPLAAVGDLAALALLESDGSGTADDFPSRLTVDIAASLRRQDDRRADSMYGRAWAVIDSLTHPETRALARRNYWIHFLPALSDTNPLPFLSQVDSGMPRQTFLRGVFSMHLAAARTDIPFRIAEQLLRAGDTTMVVRLLLDPFTTPIDYFEWQPRGDPSVFGAVMDRAMALTARSSNTAQRQSIRSWAALMYVRTDTVRFRAMEGEVTDTFALTQIREYTMLRLVYQNPDSALALLARSPNGSHDHHRSAIATALAKRGRATDAIRVVGLILSASEQSKAMVALADLHVFARDPGRVRKLVRHALETCDPRKDFDWIRGRLIPLANRFDMRPDVERWARSQPDDSRAFALIALVVADSGA